MTERLRSVRLSSIAGLLLLTAGCGQGVPGGDTPGQQGNGAKAESAVLEAGAWTRVPDPPLSARERRCPRASDRWRPTSAVRRFSSADMAAHRVRRPPTAPSPRTPQSGVAATTATNTSCIADAPRAVSAWAPAAVVGEHLYIATGPTLLAWDSTEDSWHEVRPPRDAEPSVLVADGDRLVLASGSDEYGVRHDHVLDTSTGGWATLPEDPLKPSFDRIITSTPHGLVLTAKPIAPDGGPADPALVHAALLPPGESSWRMLPTSDQLGGWRWAWTGKHLVDPTLGGADGGQVNNFGRVIPFGGRLDPVTGTWSRLPDAPGERTGGWPVEVLDGPLSRPKAGCTTTTTARGPACLGRRKRPPSLVPGCGPARCWSSTAVLTGAAQRSPTTGHRRTSGRPGRGSTGRTDEAQRQPRSSAAPLSGRATGASSILDRAHERGSRGPAPRSKSVGAAWLSVVMEHSPDLAAAGPAGAVVAAGRRCWPGWTRSCGRPRTPRRCSR